MIRLACAFQLASLVVLTWFMVDTRGPIAAVFTFFGIPLLGVSLALYGVDLVRSRRKRNHETSGTATSP